MPNQNNIDKASEEIALFVERARADLAAKLFTIGTNVNNINDFIEALLTMDIDGTLKSKLVKATKLYADAHKGVLETTTMFGKPDGNLLVSYAKLNEELLDSTIIKTISVHINTQVAQGVQSGLSANEIIQSITDASISRHQMETVVNTTLNTYSRNVTKQMMDTAPDDTLYNYIGPADGRTRSACLDMISGGRLTKAQIISNYSRYGDILSSGGGFNCRHKWDFAPAEKSAFHEVDEAKKEQAKRKADA